MTGLRKRGSRSICLGAITLGAAVMLGAGCASRSFEIPKPKDEKQTEKYYPQSIEKEVDILFVIDDSGSMEQEQTNLLRNFPKLIEALRSPKLGADGSGKPCTESDHSGCKIPNVHIGVVSTDLGAGNFGTVLTGCEQPNGLGGKLQNKARTTGCPVPSAAYINYNEGTVNINGCSSSDPIECVKESFTCIARLGIQGCGFESQLEAARKALQPGTNPGFVRDDAFLAVVFITDEDDCSARDVQLFNPQANQLGAVTSFRCFEYGIKCDVNGRTPGVRSNCVPTPDYNYLYKVDEYINFFKELKGTTREDRVIMAAIAGPTSPVAVGQDGQNPTLNPSCQTVTAGTAFPAIRIASVVEGLKGDVTTICTEDFSPALEALGKKIVANLGGQCIDAPLLLPNGGIACSEGVDVCKMPGCEAGETCNASTGYCEANGQQTERLCGRTCLDKVDCLITEKTGSTGKETPIPKCPRELFLDPSLKQDQCGTTCPCWRIVPRIADCKPTELRTTPFGFEIMRKDEPAKGSVAAARCRSATYKWYDADSPTPVQTATAHCSRPQTSGTTP